MHFSPLVQVNKSEGLYQLRVELQRQRLDDTVRVVEWKPVSLPKTPFAFQYKTMDRNILENTLVPFEGDDQRYIKISYVCNVSFKIPRIKYI
jgi:hypothetical protein